MSDRSVVKLKSLAFFILFVSSALASAQEWPVKPVRIIVPFPPGQSADLIGRVIAERLTLALGQQVLVENRPGAGSMIGTELAAKSRPDGYTLLIGGSGASVVVPNVYAKVGYNTLTDFAPITNIIGIPIVFCVNPALPIQNIQDLIKLAKQSPGKINFASSGNGSTQHVVQALFAEMAGIKLTHIPYKGVVEAVTDLVGGRVEMLADSVGPLLSQISSGKIRPIGVSPIKRIPFLPDVPTLDEQGVKGYDVMAWAGLVAPAGTPAPILDRLNNEVVKALDTPEMRKRMQELAFIPIGNSREQFGAFLKSELAKWAFAVKVSGAKVE